MIRSRTALGVAVFLVLVPVYVYYPYLIGLNSNSDAAINATNSYLTNELLRNAVVAVIRGAKPIVIYVSQGILYALLCC